jgi:hypothetical protein
MSQALFGYVSGLDSIVSLYSEAVALHFRGRRVGVADFSVQGGIPLDLES